MVERTVRMAQANNSLEGVRSSGCEFTRADVSSLERTTSNQEGSSEERWRLERPMFCEGFARAMMRSLERTAPEQEGSSEVCCWLKRQEFCEGFARANGGLLERTASETLCFNGPNLNFSSAQNSI